MKYICLVYLDEKIFGTLSESELAAIKPDARAYDDVLRRDGYLIAAEALEPVSSAKMVQTRSGKLSVTDGPFAETKEHLGGFILIQAKDMNEAIQVAAKIPLARYGRIEVRPIMNQ